MCKFEYVKNLLCSELKPRARLVLQCLIFHANKEGSCFPSLKTIAAECGYGLSTVKRALKELCEAGFIEKEARFDERKNGGQTSNLYTLTEAGKVSADELEAAAETEISEQVMNAEKSETKAEYKKTAVKEPGDKTTACEYIYTFTDGMRKSAGKIRKAVRSAGGFSPLWTGGQSIFNPP